MSILIKGMKMPKNCFECVCKHKFFGEMKCYEFPDFEFGGTEKFPHMEDRSHYCPLVPIQPHGRLIDADALEEEPCDVVEDRFPYSVSGHSNDQIRNAPTIIECDRH